MIYEKATPHGKQVWESNQVKRRISFW